MCHKFQEVDQALQGTVKRTYRGAASSTAGGRLQPPTGAWKPIHLPCHILSTHIEAQLQGALGLPHTAVSYSQACCRGGGGGGRSGALGGCRVSDGGIDGGQECV